MFFILILFISFNFSQSGFSSFRRNFFYVNCCVDIRVEMCWFLVSFFFFFFFRNKILFSRLTMWFSSALIRLFSFCRYAFFGGYWRKCYFVIDLFKWLSAPSSYISKTGFIFSLKFWWFMTWVLALFVIGMFSILSNKRLLRLWLHPNSITTSYMWLGRRAKLVLRVTVHFCKINTFIK